MIKISGEPVFVGNTVVIDGNNLEEQLTLILSPRLDHQTSIVAVHAQLTGNVKIVHEGMMSQGLERCILSGIIANWICFGIHPTEQEKEFEFRKAGSIIGRICEEFEL